jgi:hypothetical protein
LQRLIAALGAAFLMLKAANRELQAFNVLGVLVTGQ